MGLLDFFFGNSAGIEEPTARPMPSYWWDGDNGLREDATDEGNTDTSFLGLFK